MKVKFHPAFRTDFAEATRYYRNQAGKQIAEDFVAEVTQVIQDVKSNPEQFPVIFGEIRSARLRRFHAYAIRYDFDGETSSVYFGSLLHGARNPDLGKDRF